jgi:hypothetical protein
MTKAFFLGAAATILLLVATASASAQSTAAPAVMPFGTATHPVAGGAAGRLPYLTYAWENTLARLGLGQSDDKPAATPTQTPSADAH